MRSDMKVQVDEQGWELQEEPDAAAAVAEPTPTNVPSSGVYARVENSGPPEDELSTLPTEPAPASMEALAQALPPPPRVPSDLTAANADVA